MVYIILLLVSIFLTYCIRWYTIKKSILDIPNERSSHTHSTPTGGGLAIVSTFYIGLFYFKEQIDIHLFTALLWAIPITIVSILDDIYTLSSKIRFIIQSLSSIMALYSLGGVNNIDFIWFELNGFWLNILAFVSMLWLTNLYNFLDGIDGYAAMETITVGIGFFILFQNPLGLVVSVSSLGFLFFNWHKASIFMGDVGSVTLGFIFSIFVFYDTGHGNIYIWLILLSLFWFDATVTLSRRYFNHEKITEAHKKHAYQRLVQSGWSPSRVVMYSGSINFFFLFLLDKLKTLQVLLIINIIIMYLLLKFIDMKKDFK